jgi:hypothetical protein
MLWHVRFDFLLELAMGFEQQVYVMACLFQLLVRFLFYSWVVVAMGFEHYGMFVWLSGGGHGARALWHVCLTFCWILTVRIRFLTCFVGIIYVKNRLNQEKSIVFYILNCTDFRLSINQNFQKTLQKAGPCTAYQEVYDCSAPQLHRKHGGFNLTFFPYSIVICVDYVSNSLNIVVHGEPYSSFISTNY